MHVDETEVKQWIAEQLPAITEDLKRICRIRSVSQPEGAQVQPFGEGCIKVLEEMLALGRENGFETHNFENYVGRITCPGSTEESIGIWAHLDVVDEGEGWVYPPYEPTVKDGYFIARGCQDNKSSAIMALYLLKYLRAHGIKPKHTISLYCGTSEEQGMQDMDYYTAHYPCPDFSLVPDSGFPVCCGERGTFNGELWQERLPETSAFLDAHCDCGLYTIPDQARAELAYTDEHWARCSAAAEGIRVSRTEKGILIEAEGVSTQASNAANGVSALTRLAEFICSRELLTEQDAAAFRLICDMNRKNDGNALGCACEDRLSGPVVMPATQLFMREGRPVIAFISKFPITKGDVPFEKNAEREAKKRGFSFKQTRYGKPNCFDPESPVLKALGACSNRVLGRNDKPFVMSGGTYARKLERAVAFGTGMPLPPIPEGMFLPGHGDYHQPDESISLLRIQKALEIYILGILEIDDMKLR